MALKQVSTHPIIILIILYYSIIILILALSDMWHSILCHGDQILSYPSESFLTIQTISTLAILPTFIIAELKAIGKRTSDLVRGDGTLCVIRQTVCTTTVIGQRSTVR